MKITSGLGSIDDYPRYARAGADELFCGYVPFSWSEKYGTVLPLNRREVLNYNVQIGSFSELEILANMVQKYQKPVHLRSIRCITGRNSMKKLRRSSNSAAA
mgnify:CR=1 FL=1